MNLASGSRVSHYEILSPLGKGGMGEVYLARDTKLDRQVAIKFLNEKYTRDDDVLRRFVREAKAASALNHPNILTVYEIGETADNNFIVAEFIEGKTLGEHLSMEKVIPLDTVLKISVQIAEALAAAHQAGIVHRDIKPDNIMIRNDGYAKILDFGLAKLTEKKLAEKFSDENHTTVKINTVPGLVMGTIFYMSPEQARGKKVDTRTDIFSFGVVLYELLTRRLPFRGETASHTIVEIIEKNPPPLTTGDFHIPAALEEITFRAMAKNPDDRYQNTTELVSDLKELRRRIEFEAEFTRNTPTRVFKTFPTATVDTANTIAVLPFLNMSRSEDGDYFSDGLAEELLNVLSKIKGLRVAARTSAFSFKGKQTTIAEIGRALNVASVLEGSIRMAGQRVRIAVQLVNVADGYHIWSETYNRTMEDIFAVQDDIAQSVVEELRTRLVGEKLDTEMSGQIISEVAEAVKGRAENPEAQRLMLLGRHFLDRTTREDTATAIKYFKDALKLDARYALCWAELGRAYSIEAGRGWVNVDEGFSRSREAVNRALTLEPELPEGHAQIGRIRITHDWDFSGAEASFQKALDLAPGNSSVLDGAGVLAYKLGNFEKAVELSHRVLIQDPLSAAFWHNLGLTCHAADRLIESEAAFRRALELVPQRFVSRALLALVLMDQGKPDEAAAQAQLEPDEFWRLWALTIIYYSVGRTSDSDESLRKLKYDYAKGNAYQIAEANSIRNETDAAFEWLEYAFNERDPGITHTKVNPRFRPLHSDPRWIMWLKKIGFEI